MHITVDIISQSRTNSSLQQLTIYTANKYLKKKESNKLGIQQLLAKIISN